MVYSRPSPLRGIEIRWSRIRVEEPYSEKAGARAGSEPVREHDPPERKPREHHSALNIQNGLEKFAVCYDPTERV